MTSPRIGLVLGGGGARGLAHIPVIEALDDLGLRVDAVAGASIGAIFGAGLAAGLTGRAMRDVALANFRNRARLIAKLWELRPRRLADLWQSGGITQIDPEKVLELFTGELIPPHFDDLVIPFAVATTDFNHWGAHVITRGNLRRAVAASMAIPVLFRAVAHEGRVLMDGGIVNPLPLDALPAKVDLVIAVDVMAYPEPTPDNRLPTTREALFGATQILMQAVVAEKVRAMPPDLLLRPQVSGYGLLDFHRVDEIFAALAPLKDDVKRRLDRILAADTPAVELVAPPARKRLTRPRRALPKPDAPPDR